MQYLTSMQLCGLIIGIQASAPNWWWSIHQNSSGIEVRSSPTTAADYCSRMLMMTPEGDEGVLVKGHAPGGVLLEFNQAMEELLKTSVRKVDKVPDRVNNGRDCGVYDPACRDRLSVLFSKFDTLELPNGIVVSEVMFGSCPTSLDCSIRLSNGLDLSVDLTDPRATLDEVFAIAISPFEARMTGGA